VNCYRVTLAIDQVELLAPNAATAALSAMELYPGQQVLSVLLQPDWEDDDDDHPSLTAAERNPSLR
jgi:hypothetical protein